MQTVLFLCTGNYYRSRYAEAVFNWQARKEGSPWSAFSRGLDPSPFNVGPVSRETIAALRKLGIPLDEPPRFPIVACEHDFRAAHHVVAVKEAEHRPLIERKFAAWLERVEFWHVDDLDGCGPEETLPHLDKQVAALLRRLAESGTR